ncbi:cytochrome o ubiquinol oxidase subunit IV [Salinispira pacifica]
MSNERTAGAAHGGLRSYVIGFSLAIVLTVIPFVLVMTGALPKTATIVIILAFAVVQILVHLVYFLHLNASSEQHWNFLAAVYTLIVLIILVGASIWIMYHLNYNMMVNPQQIVP